MSITIPAIGLAILAKASLYFGTGIRSSACYGNQSQGVMVAAASDTFWNGGAACGKYYNVRCTRDHNVTVKIVDHCPDCSSTIDLSREAFAKIAKPMAGIVIDIDYHQVEVTQRLE
ncbi:putative EG45-like domain containing protein 1 [Quercus suber]